MTLAIAAAALLAASNCIDALCNAQTLAPYFEKLGTARGRTGRPVHILQIGDSHTAGDAITGAWRDLLQARYGSGGRGVLPPGRPYAGYLTHGATVTASDGWRISGTFGAGSAYPHPAIGMSGFSATSDRDGATMSLTADGGEAFDRFVICGLAEPSAGTLSVRIGMDETHVDFDSNSARAQCRTITMATPQSVVEIVAQGRPVTITSWATFRDGGGVALSNLGVVGSQLIHFARTDDAVLAEEFRAYRPDLIVVAFGTNEGFSPRLDPWSYEIVLRTQIGRLRRLAGNVPILLLGAPDASTRRSEMLANAPGPTPAPCASGTGYVAAPLAPPSAQPAADAPGTLARIMSGIRAQMGLGDATPEPASPACEPAPAQPPPTAPYAPAPPVASSARGPLFPPAGLAAVREVQRRVAASLNIAFWDWQARMGGACTAPRWVHASPPLMRGDYVHYTSAGGHEIATRLEADLERAAAAR